MVLMCGESKGYTSCFFVGGGFISPAYISAGDLDISGWWIPGLWICAGAMNGAPTMGAYYIVPIMVGCSVPEQILANVLGKARTKTASNNIREIRCVQADD